MITVSVLLFVSHIVIGQEIVYYPSRFAMQSSHKKVERLHVSKIRHFSDIIENYHIPTKNCANQNDIEKSKARIRVINSFDVNDNVTKLENIDISQRFKRNHANKRAVDPVFHGHPKTKEEKWNDNILNATTAFDQNPSLITLLHTLTQRYLNECVPVILYDKEVASNEGHLFQDLFGKFPVSYVHGIINDNNHVENPDILKPVKECVHYILFLTDIKRCGKAISTSESKVVIVARTSQWAIEEFLAGKISRKFVNLLVLGQSFKDGDNTLEAPYILYTHQLYIDGLGASKPLVLTSWIHGKFSREVDLFPPKMTEGYAGHRFIVAAANQPPFVIRRIQSDLDGGNPRVVWDGIEVRVLKLLAERNNFSIEIVEPRDLHLGSGDAVAKEVAQGRADVGIAGMYLSSDRIREIDMSFSHSQDCAVFVTLLSTALPRYRAILGPFHWHVWLALTLTYLLGIFPFAFSDKHSLRHLLNNPGEVENMFWYVFGTFTNCFTFVGKNSWSKTDKITTRLLIGWYWIFTIIITSCYTGSIIAFVTLPIFPETIDTIDQLLHGFFRIGTLDRGGWERWFFNSSDPKTNKLLSKMEFVPNVEAGIRNTTKAFFWSYSFLGSRAELEYIVQANFSAAKSKRAQLHISNECFVPFGVSLGFPNQSIYTAKLSSDISRMYQSGLLDKLIDEVRWDIQRSVTGKLLAVSPGSLKIVSAEEKGLTLEDTQGMFLLLGAGFLISVASLISEWMGGCSRYCNFKKKKDEGLSSAKSTEKLIPTPDSDSHREIKIISDEVILRDEAYTGDSNGTLDGNIITVSQESILVHNHFEADDFGSRRSSSVEVDREIQEIFDGDVQNRLSVHSEVDEEI